MHLVIILTAVFFAIAYTESGFELFGFVVIIPAEVYGDRW